MAECIGTATCPETGEPAQVREDKRHWLYLVSEAGIWKYQSATGQARLFERWRQSEPDAAAAWWEALPHPPPWAHLIAPEHRGTQASKNATPTSGAAPTHPRRSALETFELE